MKERGVYGFQNKKRGMKKKAQLNLSFGWIFAIIIGATILVLTIVGTTKVVKNNQQEQAVVGASQLAVLFNPLETGFESATSTFIATKVPTRIYNNCLNSGDFGEQRLSLSEFSFDEWPVPGSETSFKNKYIFSKDVTEGKRFYLFSKPFEFPFKIGDLIYLSSEQIKYCFDDAPRDIEDEINQIGQENLASNCTNSEGYRKVCFDGGSSCDINVNYDEGYVEKKNSEKVYFEGDALMYAAIFSDRDIYECGVQRLSKRMNILASIYADKSIMMSKEGCESDLQSDMDFLSNVKINDSSDLKGIYSNMEDIRIKNKYSNCALW